MSDISLRDSQGDQEVAEILAGLKADHPARKAFLEGRPTMEILRLVRDRQDIARKLLLSYWDCHRRSTIKSVPAGPRKKR